MFLPSLLAHGGGGWFPLEMPPVHPIFVNFTASLVPASFAADFFGRWLKKPSLLASGWWAMGLAAAITPMTAAAGWWWMRQMQDMDHPQMAVHKWLGIAITVVLIGCAVWRGWMFRKSVTPGVAYLLLSAALVGALMVQGHLGGTMSFTSESTPDENAATRPSGMQPHHNSETTMPATTSMTNEGWSDSIKVKENKHE